MLLIPAIATLLGTASAVNALRNVTIYANDTLVTYTGFDWKPYTNCGGTQYTYSVGHFFQYSFTGVAVYLYTTRSLEGGLISMQVDGDSSSADRYALPPYQCGYPLLSKTNLQNTRHNLVVTMSGNSITNTTTRGFIEWQWLIYTELEDGDLDPAGTSGTPSSNYPSLSGFTSTRPTNSGTALPASTGSSNTAIIGGAVGGVVGGLALLGLVAFLIWRKKRSTQGGGRTDLGDTYEPKPFDPNQANHVQHMPVLNSNPAPNQYGAMPQWPGPNQSQSGPIGTHPGMYQQHAGYPASSAGYAPSATGYAPSTTGYAPSATGYPAPYPTGSPPLGPQSPNSYDPYATPSGQQQYPASSTSGSGSGTKPLLALHTANSGLGESDVDRIAARVASMMGPQQAAGVPHAASPDFDAPPPMYNEKGPIR